MRTMEQLIETVLDAVTDGSTVAAVPVVRSLLEFGASGRRLEGFRGWCEEAGYSSKTIARKLTSAGLTTPSKIVALGSVLHVMHRYVNEKEDHRYKKWPSLFRISTSLGWSNEFVLSQWIYRNLGTRPSTLWESCRSTQSVEPLIEVAVPILRRGETA